ncbi:MAG: hypothetical protein HYY44_04910 [Deltaproteobacteria bacterium]|nr:hypothetical protein [Deltaproteobacteria bacterium]MBI4373421.1 hypothetical protein [Deltaproteobacteria bacterium]
MPETVSLSKKFEAVLGHPPTGSYDLGIGQCTQLIDKAKEGQVKWGQIDQSFKLVQEGRLFETQPPEFRWGFAKACRWTGPFLNNPKKPIAEKEIENSLQQIREGYAPHRLLLRKQGVDPVEAEKSTLENPKTFLKSSPKPGTSGRIVHLVAVMPASIDEAARILGLEATKMKERSPLCLQSDLAGTEKPNLEGRPFIIKVGLDLPWPMKNRYFNVRVKAFKWGKPGDPNEGMRIDMQYVANSGNINAFEGTAEVWKIDPKRFILSFRLYADMDLIFPQSWIQNMQTKQLGKFVRRLVSEVRK